MPSPMTAEAVLNRCFLEMRAKALEIGAMLDRIESAPQSSAVRKDARLSKLHDAIAVLQEDRPERAARIQMIFSDEYDPKWTRPRPR